MVAILPPAHRLPLLHLILTAQSFHRNLCFVHKACPRRLYLPAKLQRIHRIHLLQLRGCRQTKTQFCVNGRTKYCVFIFCKVFTFFVKAT